ncbi:MAG: 3-phosphoshikimate 1-carboxyvinyltransferase [Bacteroidales bacterium]|nr:3-phosphoshikimate 1-carboxyvinyltransferase [Bacteroidales bacterium]
MKVVTSIHEVKGKIRAPSSKSAAQRYIAGALLADGISVLKVNSMCDDSLAALSVAEALGAEVSSEEAGIIIKGGFDPVKNEINCGESGLSARMFIPIAALHNEEITITGRGSLLNRPFEMAEKPLAQLGVKIFSKSGFLPVTVKGPLSGGEVTADGSVSSQFITGLLMALPVVGKDSRLIVSNLVSKPYIDITLKILSQFGIEIINDNYTIFSIRGGQKYIPGAFTVEGDWSGASFFLVMGAIGGTVEIEGLDMESVQADRAIIDALLLAGASVETKSGKVTVSKSDLRNFEFDITNCPDIAPPLAVLASACRGKSVIRGAARLLAKESNRADTISNALNSIGAKVSCRGDMIEVEGMKSLSGGEAKSYNDHRIAMALAAASLLSVNPVIIDGIECIKKSYPGFIEDFKSVGGYVTLIK